MGKIDTEDLAVAAREKLGPVGHSWAMRKTITAWAGIEHATPVHLAAVGAALHASGIFTCPADLTGAKPNDVIRFSVKPFDDPGLGFTTHRELAEFLQAHFRSIPIFNGCRRTQLEFPIPHHDLIIDLLGFARKRLVVTELKLDDGGFKIASQLQAYMEAMMENEEKADGRVVEGIAITGRRNPPQEAELRDWADARGVSVKWFLFNHLFKLIPHPTETMVESGAGGVSIL